MTTRIGVIGDTHLTSATDLSERIAELFSDVERILHTGDVLADPVLQELEEIAPVEAVSGNMDYPAMKARLAEKSVFEIESARVGLIHGHGVSGAVLDRKDWDAMHDYLRSEFDESVDCIVYGHTHVAMNEEQQGVLFFNPGTATGRGAKATVGILTVDGNQVSGELIDL